MRTFLIYTLLFSGGSVCGWVIELFFRRFFSRNNPERKWINPGFLNGPYLPLYGFGLCAMYTMTKLENYILTDSYIMQKIILFVIMALAMTVIEYIAGVIFIKGMKTKLWDYSDQWGNIGGIICPKFSFFWAVLSAAYYFLIHPYVLDSILWITENPAYSFFIGMFFGVFLIDVAYSLQIVVKIRKFAADNDIIVRYERLKLEIRQKTEERHLWLTQFLLQFRSEHPLIDSLNDHLKQYRGKQIKK